MSWPGALPGKRRDSSQTRDTALLRADLTRLVVGGDTLPYGVRMMFIAKAAKMDRRIVGDVLSGRRERVTLKTHGDLLNAIAKIEAGEIEVPEKWRRKPGRAAVKAKPGECARGHKLVEGNVYYRNRNGKRSPYCKTCHDKAHKEWRVRRDRAAATAPENGFPTHR